MASCVIPFESMLVLRLEVNNQVDCAFDSRKYLYKSAQNSNGVGDLVLFVGLKDVLRVD